MTTFFCNGNKLTELDISKVPGLKKAVSLGTNDIEKYGYSKSDGFEFGYALDTDEDGTEDYLLITDPGIRIYIKGKSMVLTLPANVEQIAAEAFSGCNAGEYYLGEQVKSIGARAFADLKQEAVIYMPSGDVSIDDTAFEGSSVTLACTPGSAAEKWAREHGFPVITK